MPKMLQSDPQTREILWIEDDNPKNFKRRKVLEWAMGSNNAKYRYSF